MRVSVHVGSLVDRTVDCDAIVNASNPDVALGSGVSGAIREACGGAAFQREVRDALDATFGRPLGIGDCLVTTGGTADAFRWVLHVPAVDYRLRDPETSGVTGPTRIRSCVASALDAATRISERHGLRGAMRVALPLLGAGFGGLGAATSAELVVGALRSWIESTGEPSPLGEIRIVVLDDAGLRLVERAMATHGLHRTS